MSDTVKQPDMEVDEQGYLGSPVEEKTSDGSREGAAVNANSGPPHPDDPEGKGFHGPADTRSVAVMAEHLAQQARQDVAAATYLRARFGEGKSIEDAVAVVKAKTGLVPAYGSPAVAAIEADEAEHPDEVAKMRERWEAIVAAENEPVTTGETE